MEFRLHHRLSKFDWSVFLNLKPISYSLAFIWLGFLSRNYWSLLDYDLMASIWEKALSILAGNLNSGCSYIITAALGRQANYCKRGKKPPTFLLSNPQSLFLTLIKSWYLFFLQIFCRLLLETNKFLGNSILENSA